VRTYDKQTTNLFASWCDDKLYSIDSSVAKDIAYINLIACNIYKLLKLLNHSLLNIVTYYIHCLHTVTYYIHCLHTVTYYIHCLNTATYYMHCLHTVTYYIHCLNTVTYYIHCLNTVTY